MALAVDAVNGTPWSEDAVQALSQAMADTLGNGNLDDAFKALALVLPGEALIARAIGKDIDPARIHDVRDAAQPCGVRPADQPARRRPI